MMQRTTTVWALWTMPMTIAAKWARYSLTPKVSGGKATRRLWRDNTNLNLRSESTRAPSLTKAPKAKLVAQRKLRTERKTVLRILTLVLLNFLLCFWSIYWNHYHSWDLFCFITCNKHVWCKRGFILHPFFLEEFFSKINWYR